MSTSFEVIDALLRNTPAERMGSFENVWRQTQEEWTHQGLPTDEDGDPVDYSDHLNLDMVGTGISFQWEPIPDFREVVEETDEWHIVKNGGGALLKRWKTRAGTPEHIDFTMTSRDIWDRDYRPHLMEHNDRKRVPQDMDEAHTKLKNRRDAQKWAYYGSQFIWESMRATLGDYNLYISMIEDQDWIHDIGRVYTDMFKRCYTILFEEIGLPDGVWVCEDLGYRDRMFVNPELYRELIFPYFTELVAFFHEHDLPVVLHTCGMVEPALDMIVEAGFDALHPMEVKAGNDIFRIADGYADKLCFIGGLDARILERGDRDEIRREIVRLIDGLKARGARWVFASDHSLSTNVRYEAYTYALEVYREHMTY